MNVKTNGWTLGAIGVAIFSASLPATRIAVFDFDPIFLTFARATLAGTAAAFCLTITRQSPPSKSDLASIALVALGVVVGFPILTALALQDITSARSVVFIGLMPLATATFGTLRGGEAPSLLYWVFSIAGSMLVVGFALLQNQSASLMGDVFMLAAVMLGGMGYAEGGRLARRLGGWQVISWALAFALPVMLPLAFLAMPETFDNVGQPAWLALGYVSMFSMFIGFFFWYRGLAQGGIAAVGQLQLLQPFLGLMLAAVLLKEVISLPMVGVSVAVLACVICAKRFA